VLFKGARVTAHLLQNLDLLALPNGSPLETSYGERWLAANVAGSDLPRAGESVLIVLLSPPYSTLVPARFATLEGVEARGSFYSFRLALGPYLATEDHDRVAGLIRNWDPGLRPREKFVARGLAGERLAVAVADSDVTTAWNSLTQRLKTERDYQNALFARVASAPTVLSPGVSAEVVVHVGTTQPVAAAAAQLELRQGSAVLGAQEYREGVLRVQLTAETNEELDGSLRVIAGELIAPLLPFHIAVEIEQERHAATDESGETDDYSEVVEIDGTPEAVGGTSSSPPAHTHPKEVAKDRPTPTEIALNGAELRRLMRDARELSSPSDVARRLGELAVEAVPDDVELSAETARFLAEVERWEETAALLGRFEPAMLPRDALYDRFLADCATGRVDDANRLLTRLDFETDNSFKGLQEALALLPDHSAVRLGLQLVTESLGEARSLELFHELRNRITDARDVHDFAEAMQYVSEHESIGLLLEHTRGESPDRKLLELLTSIASATPGNQRIGSQIIALGRLRLEADEVEGVFDLLAAAKTEARTDERLELVKSLAEALAQLQSRRHDAVVLLTTEVETALSAGLVECAAELASQAVGIAAGDESAEALAHEALERTERALEASQPLRTLLALQRESRIASAREEINGRKLAIVGGSAEAQTAETLRATFGFSEVRWIPSEKNKPANISALLKMDSGKTVVVVLTERIGHSRSEPVIKHCETHGIPCVLSRLGPRGIEDALLSYAWSANHST
jgi:hypothetical protein